MLTFVGERDSQAHFSRSTVAFPGELSISRAYPRDPLEMSLGSSERSPASKTSASAHLQHRKSMRPSSGLDKSRRSISSQRGNQFSPDRGPEVDATPSKVLSDAEMKSCVEAASVMATPINSMSVFLQFLRKVGLGVEEEIVTAELYKLFPNFDFHTDGAAALSFQQAINVVADLKLIAKGAILSEADPFAVAPLTSPSRNAAKPDDTLDMFVALGGSRDRTGTITLSSVRQLLWDLCRADWENYLEEMHRKESMNEMRDGTMTSAERRSTHKALLSESHSRTSFRVASTLHTTVSGIYVPSATRSGGLSPEGSQISDKLIFIADPTYDSIPYRYIQAFDRFWASKQTMTTVNNNGDVAVVPRPIPPNWKPGLASSVRFVSSTQASPTGSSMNLTRQRSSVAKADLPVTTVVDLVNTELDFHETCELMDIIRGGVQTDQPQRPRNWLAAGPMGAFMRRSIFSPPGASAVSKSPSTVALVPEPLKASNPTGEESTEAEEEEDNELDLEATQSDDDQKPTSGDSPHRRSTAFDKFRGAAKSITGHIKAKDGYAEKLKKDKFDLVMDRHSQRLKSVEHRHNETSVLLKNSRAEHKPLWSRTKLTVLLPSGEDDQEMILRMQKRNPNHVTRGKAPKSTLDRMKQMEALLSDPEIAAAVDARTEAAREKRDGWRTRPNSRQSGGQSRTTTPFGQRSTDASLLDSLGESPITVRSGGGIRHHRPMTATPNDLVQKIATLADFERTERGLVQTTPIPRDRDVWGSPPIRITQREYLRQRRLDEIELANALEIVEDTLRSGLRSKSKQNSSRQEHDETRRTDAGSDPHQQLSSFRHKLAPEPTASIEFRRTKTATTFVFCEDAKLFQTKVPLLHFNIVPDLIRFFEREMEDRLPPYRMVDDVYYNPTPDSRPDLFTPVPDIETLITVAHSQLGMLRLKVITRKT